MTYYIYALVDPRKPEVVRYVGRTKNKLTRHLQHCTGLGVGCKYQWLEQLRNEGVLPQMIVLETVTTNERDATEREHYWIKHHDSRHLTNAAKRKPKYTVRAQPIEPGAQGYLHQQTERQKRDLLVKALHDAESNKSTAAKMLGVSRPTLYDMMQRFGVSVERQAV